MLSPIMITTMDLGSIDSVAHPNFSTTVRCLWSDQYLYIAYECPFTKLTTFEPASGKRIHLTEVGKSLWDRDVIEAFIGSNTNNLNQYAEFEVAPTNERLDVKVDLPQKDFNWNSQFESAVKVDTKKQIWTCEIRIPFSALSNKKPEKGARWRMNLYRCDYANNTFLACGVFGTMDR